VIREIRGNPTYQFILFWSADEPGERLNKTHHLSWREFTKTLGCLLAQFDSEKMRLVVAVHLIQDSQCPQHLRSLVCCEFVWMEKHQPIEKRTS
jgi:hypothetical protein